MPSCARLLYVFDCGCELCAACGKVFILLREKDRKKRSIHPTTQATRSSTQATRSSTQARKEQMEESAWEVRNSTIFPHHITIEDCRLAVCLTSRNTHISMPTQVNTKGLELQHNQQYGAHAGTRMRKKCARNAQEILNKYVH